MIQLRILSTLLLFALSTSCGRTSHTPDIQPELELMLKPLGSAGSQTWPGAEVRLKVFAVLSAGSEIEDADDLRPAIETAIAWRFLGGTPEGASLSVESSATDSSGIAVVDVGVGPTASRTLQVEASAEGANSVTFSITIGADRRELEILGDTTINALMHSRERIRMRLTRLTSSLSSGVPIADEALHIQLIGGARNYAGLDDNSLGEVSTTTNSSGIADLVFQTGNTQQTYEILVCGGTSCTGIDPVTITINVSLGGGSGAECYSFFDCDPGYVCIEGLCKPAGNYCNTTAECPTGYICSTTTRECVIDDGTSCNDNNDCVNDEICGIENCCVPPDGCQSNAHCPDGFTCDACSGACLPPGAIAALDVSGSWDTVYQLDLSDTLPGLAQDIQPVVDFLDVLFRSELDINVPIVGDIVEALLDSLVAEYVPDWSRTVVEVLVDITHLFDALAIEGEMFLVQTPTGPPLGTVISGEEEWLSAKVFLVGLCEGGVAEYERDRECAAVDIVLDPSFDVSYSNNSPTVDVVNDPFNGEVQAKTLKLFGRHSELALRQLVNVVLDIVITMASDGEYGEFEFFLQESIPCEDMQLAFDDMMCDLTDGDICSVPGLQEVCEAAGTLAVAAMTTSLGNIPVKLELDYDARVIIHDNNADKVADILGNPANPSLTNESAIDGESDFAILGGDLDEGSWWYGTR